MFEKLGHILVRHRKAVLTLFFVILIMAGASSSLLIPRLSSGGYNDPSSQSAKADAYLASTFHVKDPALALVVDSKTSVTDPTTSADAAALEKAISGETGVTKVLSYWSAGGAPALKSVDGKAGYLFVYTANNDPGGSTDLAKLIQKKYDGTYKSLHVYVGGFSTISYAISSKISKDLAVAESISIPLTFLLLLFIFGGLIASAMPLVVGLSAILGTFLILYLISLATGVSIFALNLTTGMGLGLGIDYSLLIVNRFREELHSGKSVEDSIARTVATAGRTVFFSGLTVLVTISSLMFFPLMFLKSFGYAGIGVVFTAVFGALIPLPAILAMLGTRIDKFVVRKSAITPKEDGRWAQTARFVMKRPVAVVVLVLMILAILATPIKNIVFSEVDSRVLPANNHAAIASAVSIARFDGQSANPIEIIIPGGATHQEELARYSADLAKVKNIVAVSAPQIVGNDARISATFSIGSRTTQAETMINAVRNIPAPFKTLVGGTAADYTDTQAGISRTVPWALGWIALSVLLLLFMYTGSIILPIKAVVLNILSLGATIGALSWIFIEGHMTWLVGSFTKTGTIDTSMVILTCIVVFGLSMDYEVFLLSRIKEEHDSGRSNIDAVATGLQRSARIITSAAVLLAVVFAVFLTSGVTNIKTLGFGVAFAILLDSTLVRALLVPALMRLFGERNWWAPQALKRFTISH
jgi:putative drug exporter of the RND superfamily